jgi:hypothetical protein
LTIETSAVINMGWQMSLLYASLSSFTSVPKSVWQHHNLGLLVVFDESAYRYPSL